MLAVKDTPGREDCGDFCCRVEAWLARYVHDGFLSLFCKWNFVIVQRQCNPSSSARWGAACIHAHAMEPTISTLCMVLIRSECLSASGGFLFEFNRENRSWFVQFYTWPPSPQASLFHLVYSVVNSSRQRRKVVQILMASEKPSLQPLSR